MGGEAVFLILLLACSLEEILFLGLTQALRDSLLSLPLLRGTAYLAKLLGD